MYANYYPQQQTQSSFDAMNAGAQGQVSVQFPQMQYGAATSSSAAQQPQLQQPQLQQQQPSMGFAQGNAGFGFAALPQQQPLPQAQTQPQMQAPAAAPQQQAPSQSQGSLQNFFSDVTSPLNQFRAAPGNPSETLGIPQDEVSRSIVSVGIVAGILMAILFFLILRPLQNRAGSNFPMWIKLILIAIVAWFLAKWVLSWFLPVTSRTFSNTLPLFELAATLATLFFFILFETWASRGLFCGSAMAARDAALLSREREYMPVGGLMRKDCLHSKVVDDLEDEDY